MGYTVRDVRKSGFPGLVTEVRHDERVVGFLFRTRVDEGDLWVANTRGGQALGSSREEGIQRVIRHAEEHADRESR